MGLFKNMKDMQSQAQEAMGSSPGASTGMGGDMTGQAAYAQLAQKLHQSGVESPGVIHSIRPTGQTDMGGGQQVEFDVSIKPASGEPYQATVKQSMLPAQMEDLSEGQSITVKYDPEAPAMALIFGW
jgi:hypothetical protein